MSPHYSLEIKKDSSLSATSLNGDRNQLGIPYHLTPWRLKTTRHSVPPHSTEIENNSSLSAISLYGD
jgi:hypothetical protein